MVKEGWNREWNQGGCGRLIIARLNGDDIKSEMERHISLVRNGIAGFIVFGGELHTVREGIAALQAESIQHGSGIPLIISSDLERGLGQQLGGGTVLPPAMALGRAWQKDPELVRESFRLLAQEASYAGINTIFAPVLDIDSNPDNPIISTRAFGHEPGIVSEVGVEMIRIIEGHGIFTCAKHFPGHGDTTDDSHMGLPVLDKGVTELEASELIPFKAAIKAGTSMMMTGHLSVPALDPDGRPVTLSKKAISYLREMGFDGVIATDALDMGALGQYTQAKASEMALHAGVDMLLHPSDPERLMEAMRDYTPSTRRLDSLRERALDAPSDKKPSVSTGMVRELSRLALSVEGDSGKLSDPVVIALTDDGDSKGSRELARSLGIEAIIVESLDSIPGHSGDMILTVSSSVRAYKGGQAGWIHEALERLAPDAGVLVSMGGTGLIRPLETGAQIIYAYWDSAEAGRAVSEVIKDACT